MAQVKKTKTSANINGSKPQSKSSLSEQVDELRRLVEENLRYTKNTNSSVKAGSQEGLEKLLKENLKISKELLDNSKKIRRWVAWQRAWGVVKILIIAVPIILGIIYLPPLIEDLVKPVQELFNFGPPVGDGEKTLLENLKDRILTNETI